MPHVQSEAVDLHSALLWYSSLRC